MPSRAKTTMKRKSRNSKLMMDFIELRRDTTRFRRDAQYLTGTHAHVRRSTEGTSSHSRRQRALVQASC